MILSFSGDPFLAARAARRALREQGLRSGEIVELGEGLDAEAIRRQSAQGGLFGRVGLLLDFDQAFTGKAGVKPRNEAIEALAHVPPETVVAVLDTSASASRQKRYGDLGRHEHLPTPRFGGLVQWVRSELQEAGIDFERDVPDALVDLFGEDLPGIASEINKLRVLQEKLTARRVREIAGRLAARDAFDLIEAIAAGEAARALTVCQSLVSQGEAPPRVLAALIWQYGMVARCVALLESRGRVGESEVARELGVKPFVAKKSLKIAGDLDEAALRQVLSTILAADRAMKSGRDEAWSLEALALELSELHAAA